jgi:hypothetical protein
VADTADSKMRQTRYLIMVISPWRCWIVYESEVEKFYIGADYVGEYPQ